MSIPMRNLVLVSFGVVSFAVGCGGSASTPDGGSSSDAGGFHARDGGFGHLDAGHPTGSDAGQPTGSDGGSVAQDGGGGTMDAGMDGGMPAHGLQTVFLILEENHNWSSIKGSSSAPYINSLLTKGAHAEQYYNPPGNHPSLPNYLWIEAGTNLGVTNDGLPSQYGQTSTAHLVTQLQNAGISWKSYQEDISGSDCPLQTTGNYAPKHNPMVFFSDVTNNFSSSSQNCISHVRPYTELAQDLSSGSVGRYNFITPNLNDDMHNGTIQQGDNWLKSAVPMIEASSAYKNGGVIFITWDEGHGGDGPIGMIVLSPDAKTGYSNSIPYTHSSLLKTLQEIFHVQPLLGDAANATDLSDLFTSFP